MICCSVHFEWVETPEHAELSLLVEPTPHGEPGETELLAWHFFNEGIRTALAAINQGLLPITKGRVTSIEAQGEEGARIVRASLKALGAGKRLTAIFSVSDGPGGLLYALIYVPDIETAHPLAAQAWAYFKAMLDLVSDELPAPTNEFELEEMTRELVEKIEERLAALPPFTEEAPTP